MIETAILTLLLADAPIAAITGRVITGKMGQRETFPLITLTKVDKLSGLTMDGAVGPNEVRMQVDCWDDDVDGCRALADAVNGADDQSTSGPLHGFAGLVQWVDDEDIPRSLRLKLVELLVERATDYEPDTKLYRVGADYMVHL